MFSRRRRLDPRYWLDTLWQDTRFAFRLIARNRWISLTIVATLTVGIAPPACRPRLNRFAPSFPNR